jgi:hypothetical protein
MRLIPLLSFIAVVLMACSSDDPIDAKHDPVDAEDDAGSDDDGGGPAVTTKTVLDLTDVKTNPDKYEWFDFRPNIKKLILAGAAETEHIAILWYTVTDGGVALHYHSKTESVYVIDGTQTDAKGSYPTGTVYFNPPGSGHQVTDSSGFFLLAYAAPPDFAATDKIGEYTPIRIDTAAQDLASTFSFDDTTGLQTYTPALDGDGGLTAEFIAAKSSKDYDYEGNYLLVLDGSCDIDGVTYAKDMLVVTKSVMPEVFKLKGSKSESCLAMGLSF